MFEDTGRRTATVWTILNFGNAGNKIKRKLQACQQKSESKIGNFDTYLITSLSLILHCMC